MPKTLAENILSEKSNQDASAGDVVIADVDLVMAQDGTAPLAIKAFNDMGGGSVWDGDRVALVLDHNAPSPSEGVSSLHASMRNFASEHGISNLYDVGCGVCHQLMPEQGHVLPGDLVVGADSHTCTYGALNAFATGVGSTDAAAAMRTGKLWFRVPRSGMIVLEGSFPEGVYAKDATLEVVGQVGASGATYMSVEFTGEAVENLSIDGRLTMCNMAVEMGAKTAIMEFDAKVNEYLSGEKGTPTSPDPGANYEWSRTLEVGDIGPRISRPHRVDDVVPLEEVEGKDIDQAYLGTCTNGRLEDLEIAARILDGERVDADVRFILAPASRKILKQAMESGVFQKLVSAGAVPVTPGCGPCVGTHAGVPGDGDVVISSANRNFKGRMGNNRAFIYLGSPATVAASAMEGKITDPREFI